MKSNRYAALLLLLVALVAVIGCDGDPMSSSTGLIHVTVTDSSGPEVAPVSDVEIRIPSAGLIEITDEDGVATFEVAPGDYFVDASLCCVGPAFREYHVAVTVGRGDIETVEMQACFACL